MPPHCDSLDSPVVRAARQALEARDVDLVLPFVPREGEGEITRAFEKVIRLRKEGGVARQIADRYFFETVVRVHRAGEGAPFTGLKPAGLDVGPVIPVAEQAAETGSPRDLIELLTTIVAEEAWRRFARLSELVRHAGADVETMRPYVQAKLDLEVWAHGIYVAAKADPHGEGSPASVHASTEAHVAD
jgi:hypothetical protein